MKKTLVIGASGQIGTELTLALRSLRGADSVIATDVKEEGALLKGSGPFEKLDALDAKALEALVEKHDIKEIYHLAALLSASGEKDPNLTWDLNMGSLKNVLDICVKKKIQLFWPSSIAVFGPTTPRTMVPQHTLIEPSTMYGITKYAGELLCQYYADHRRTAQAHTARRWIDGRGRRVQPQVASLRSTSGASRVPVECSGAAVDMIAVCQCWPGRSG